MKKNKTPERPTKDFKNKPFQSLKGFAPNTVSERTRTVVPKKTTTMSSEDELALFHQAMAGTSKIQELHDEAAVVPKPRTPRTAESVPPEDAKLFLEAMGKIGTNFCEKKSDSYDDEMGFRSSSGRMRQLRRGTIRISRELDLHGYLKDEALKRLEHFLAAAFTQGDKAALVITGKGINSPDGPVLQGAVAAWLRDRGSEMVVEFCPAPPAMGGSGAFVVFLKKRRA